MTLFCLTRSAGSPGDLPNPGIEARSPTLQADSLPAEPPGKVKVLSHVQLLATPWTVAHQASPSMGFSRQEYWSGLPLLTLKQSSPDSSCPSLMCCWHLFHLFIWYH